MQSRGHRTRPAIAVTIAILLGALLGVLAGYGSRPQDRPMNVVLIVVDTTRADHLGSFGYARDTTPHIDRLAERSTVFEQAYSHSPWTMPSVASLFTSLPPRDHGIVKWEQPLPLVHLTLAEYLRRRGFTTAGFVSHVIFDPKFHFDQGFEHYDDSVLERGNPVERASSKQISSSAILWLQQAAAEPFFLWLHYFDPHSHYLSHSSYAFGSRDIDRYDSEIRHVDENIGRFLRALESLGLSDNTIVVLLADHGEEFHDHGGTQHTITLFDELVRIPLVIYVPGFTPQRIDTVVSESDVAPTLCRLLGLPEFPRQFGGRPFEIDGPSIRVEESRMVFMETLRRADKRGVRYDRWKWIHDRARGTHMLYDLAADPREKRNVINDHPEVADQLRRAVAEHYEGQRSLAEEQALPDQLREQLEALGYLQ